MDFSLPLPFAYTLDIRTEPNSMVPINIAAMLAILADLKRRDFICFKNKLIVNYI